MRRQRRTKIVATLGPASSEPAMIETLFEAGADVFRINMSHTPQDRMRALVNSIREIERKRDRPIGILADLQGPKLRIGEFAEPAVQIKNGATFALDSEPTPGTAQRVYLPHPEILAALKPGHKLLLDDGKIRLEALETSPKHAITRVVVGGKLSARKGVNLPDTTIALPALTAKDRSDLDAVLEAGADWIGLSFVQRPEDVAEAKKITRGRAAVMAKIEKPQAVTRLGDILEIADALMVARGDLGVELPLERVPGVQKQMTRAARRAGKPVVVATQMLESMISSPAPTRAEVSDVATAIFEGADAVMLSAESAAGQYPAEAVSTMDRIATEVEADPTYRTIINSQRNEPEATGADAIAAATRQIAETVDLAAIVCWTSSGSTALRVARERPSPPTVALSPNISTGRRLAVVWGVHCVVTEDARDQDDMV
ncbi:MAG: pyruvate kinase, partial [Xanthobacteraceae bacterium]|nr:pyruvate kinase [Xanthobacteraceae bacterium]